MFRPDLSADMLKLAGRESATTIGYALTGTALALGIGSVGGLLLTERLWSPIHGPMKRGRAGWAITRVMFAVPRSLHEVVFGIILVAILGLDPLVAVLAIGIPFGAVTSKVFAELIDDVPIGPELSLRAAGAGRFTALLTATVPQALSDLVSYAFYRLECSLRSAAVLGIIGAGGLGFQLALSFQSLRYEQMWTFLWALVILSGCADGWSSVVRRRRNRSSHVSGQQLQSSTLSDGTTLTNDRRTVPTFGVQSKPERDWVVVASASACVVGVPLAIWRLGLDISTLWAPRARALASQLASDAWPPEAGAGGLRQLVADSLDTVALAVLSIAIALVVSTPLSFLAHRTSASVRKRNYGRSLGAWGGSGLVRLVLLISRSVPPPVWAFVVVFVLFPGLWPGAVALGIYNAGILGRLQAEVIENSDHRPAKILSATGATRPGAFVVATMPVLGSRFAALGLYRWEVAVRETVIVGVVGAAGLGRRLDEQTSSFDYDAMLATVVALAAVTVVVDLTSASIRRSFR